MLSVKNVVALGLSLSCSGQLLLICGPTPRTGLGELWPRGPNETSVSFCNKYLFSPAAPLRAELSICSRGLMAHKAEDTVTLYRKFADPCFRTKIKAKFKSA